VKTRSWFERWHKPSEFFRAAKEGVLACFTADAVVPHFLREAYIVGAFAQIWRDARGPCQVQLVSKEEKFPDARLRLDGMCLDIEITMALAKGKKMFKEWRESKQGPYSPALTDKQRKAIAREAIPRVVKRKATKHYAVPPTLLVYTDDGRALTPPELAQLTKPWKDNFRSIYLLCGMDVVETWPKLCILRGQEPFY